MSRTRRAASVAALVALACFALAAAGDVYFRQGWSASWYATVDGERELIDRTTEHRVAFPNVHRPLARYVQGWPFERLERPTALPTIDAELRATITVPAGSPRYLGADVSREAEIEVDGEPADETPVQAGVHALRVHWTARPRAYTRTQRFPESAHFELRWGPSPDALSPVPRSALTPAAGAWDTARTATWTVALAAALLFGLVAFFAVRTEDERARRRRWAAFFTLALVLLGTGYRLFDYDVMPEFRENADELFATWNGWSLLEDGTTRGWSLWPHVYGSRVQHTEVRFFGEVRPVISPYFEHPPLLHVLVGAAAHLGGAHHWLDAKLSHTRLVPIALSALSLALMIAIGRRLFPRSPAPWLGALIYAVLPIIALQTRVIKEEALLVPLVLSMVLFFLKWRDDGRKTGHLVLAAICAGLAPIAKVPGIVWVPTLVMLVAAERGETKRAVWAALLGLGVASLLLVFGAAIDWSAFIFTQAQQGTRPTHWNLFPRFFDATLINHNLMGRGWALFLWIAFAAGVFRRGRRDMATLTLPLATYLVAISVGSGNWTFGWYIVPLYPFLCLGAGAFLTQLWRRPTLLGGTLFLVLLVMYGLNFTLDPLWAKQPVAWPIIRRAVTLTTAFALTPYALVSVWRQNRTLQTLARATTALGLAAVVVLSGYFVTHYDTIYETYHDFDRDTYFHR